MPYKVLTTPEQIEEALAEAHTYSPEPTITSIRYYPEPELDLFMIYLESGRRLAVAREHLSGLEKATPQEAGNFVVGLHGTDIYWPSLDTGHYLPNLIQGRFSREHLSQMQQEAVAA